jgi:integrase
VVLSDRFAALWLLAATTGMRRSELAGADRNLLDLDAATLTIEDTRVVVDGHTVESDGKPDSSVRTISLDSFTVALLRDYLALVDQEREAFDTTYPSHGKLMRYEDGRPLHDVRHTYATLSRVPGYPSRS